MYTNQNNMHAAVYNCFRRDAIYLFPITMDKFHLLTNIIVIVASNKEIPCSYKVNNYEVNENRYKPFYPVICILVTGTLAFS